MSFTIYQRISKLVQWPAWSSSCNHCILQEIPVVKHKYTNCMNSEFFYQWAQFFSNVYLQFIIYHHLSLHTSIDILFGYIINKKLGWHFCKPFIFLNSSTIDHYSGILIPMQSDNADTWSFTNVINYISLPTCVSEGESSGTFNDTNVTQKFSPKIFVILKKF